MIETATPTAVGSNDLFGLSFPERDYLVYDPFEGDRDVDVRCRTVKLSRARKERVCMSIERGGSHTIFPGDLHRHERAIVEGQWRAYSVCVACMDKWLTEIGRPRAERPNGRGEAPGTARADLNR